MGTVSTQVHEALAAFRATQQELSGIFAHDLNNPIQTLMVLLETAQDLAGPESPNHRALGQCVTAVTTMRGMVSGLAAAMARGPEPDDADARETCARIIAGIRPRLQRDQIAVHTEFAPLGGVARCGILDVLLLNAVLGTLETLRSRGEGSLSLIATKAPDGARISVSIPESSMGPMLPKTHRHRLHALVDLGRTRVVEDGATAAVVFELSQGVDE